MSPRLSALFGAALLFAAGPAAAADLADFTLKAAIGGALPHASKEGFFVTTLAGEPKDNPRPGSPLATQFATGSRLPFGDRARSLFEARPQLMLGGSLELGHIGSAAVSLDGLVGAGASATFEETDGMIVLSGFRLVF